MEEIDLKELFEYFKNKIGLLILITFGVCLIGSIYGLFLQTPMYKSYTTVILGTNGTTSSNSISVSDITLNENLVDTYAEIVKSRKVLDQVIADLKLDDTYDELYDRISVSALNSTEILKITVEDKNPVVAMNIANKTANYFSKEVVSLYNMNNVNVLDKAIESEKPYNISVVKQIVIYFLIGFILGCGSLFLIFYFDRTIKSVEQIEDKIKLPILGSVQELPKGGKK